MLWSVMHRMASFFTNMAFISQGSASMPIRYGGCVSIKFNARTCNTSVISYSTLWSGCWHKRVKARIRWSRPTFTWYLFTFFFVGCKLNNWNTCNLVQSAIIHAKTQILYWILIENMFSEKESNVQDSRFVILVVGWTKYNMLPSLSIRAVY